MTQDHKSKFWMLMHKLTQEFGLGMLTGVIIRDKKEKIVKENEEGEWPMRREKCQRSMRKIKKEND